MRRCALLSLILLPGCFSDPGNDGASADGSSTADTTADTTADETGTTADTTATTDGGGCTDDMDCSAGAPLCDDGECVACTQLGIGGCEMRDPSLPACIPSTGECVQCTDDQPEQCGGTTPVCVSNECAPCTANAQCVSNTCLFNTGECLQGSINVTGTVFDLVDVGNGPVGVDEASAPNVDPTPIDTSVAADGLYSLPGIPPYSLVDIDTHRDQNSPVSVTGPMSHTVASVLVQNTTPYQYDVPFITYNEMARIAFECMPESFPGGLAEAQGTDNGFPNASFFLQRSTIFGRLVDLEGDPLPELSRFAIQVKLDGWTNTHLNENELAEPNPATACWLDYGVDNKLHATTNTLSDTGLFVMFRLRNSDGVGRGLATVNVLGYDVQTVNLPSSGNIGFVEMARNDQDISRDFERDVYPIFTKEGCIACHTNGGPKDGMGATLGMRDGFEADWSLDADTVYDNLTGPGTTCLTLSGGDTTPENRICTDEPLDSLVIVRPLAEEPGVDDVHPVDIFPSLANPTVQIILEWIEQGAERGTGIGPVSFENDIYPLFQKHGCVGCHKDGGPPDGMGGVKGERDGFAADWSLSAQEVYDLMTGPGTTCLTGTGGDTTLENRICTDDPENSLFVIRPLVDPPDIDDPHPVVIFPTIDHPDMQLIINWITQGAQNN